MSWALNSVRRCVCEEDGVTAAEYAILLASIITVAIIAIQLVGFKMTDIYRAITAALSGEEGTAEG